MTLRERLKEEYPEYVLDAQPDGLCIGCPVDYGYESHAYCADKTFVCECAVCWSREMEDK